jgi:hypothetical protein
MHSGTADFIRLAKHPIRFRMFLFFKLPSAFFSGVRVSDIDENKCSVTVPYKWFSQNPFHSTYFACLSMAAEMSTGALAMAYLYKRNPAVSMLVIKSVADYFKKASGTTTFTCHDGRLIEQIIEKAITSGEAQTITVKSVGINEAKEVVAEFFITWSFKKRVVSS